jgi:hypothetical protein
VLSVPFRGYFLLRYEKIGAILRASRPRYSSQL